MNTIPYLSIGDLILIVAPAKAIPDAYISAGKNLLESWGYQVEVGPNASGNHLYFSGTREHRLNDMQWALDHPQAKAILCARGGYGSIHLIPNLSLEKFKSNPKWIIGFSDITIFHNWMNKNQYPSIHGAVPLQFLDLTPDSQTLSTLEKCLSGEIADIPFDHHRQNKLGNSEGEAVGGNLAILSSLVGTELDISYDNKILIIEDISEYAYKIDRMLWTLKMAGKLDNLAGLLIGGLTDIKSSQETFGMSIEELIRGVVDEYDYPIAFNFPFGHQLDNRSVKLGTRYSLQVALDGSELKMQ